MSSVFNNLEPFGIWKFFEEILQVPRPSKKEERIIEYLLQFGKHRKLETKKDRIGNIIIKKSASSGMEQVKTVILQSHVDMVCEKNSDVVHDFEKDAIIAFQEGNWIKAKGTTLGADDGIGIAAMLALLDDNTISHGPIECLFTVDEESGLTGAFDLQAGFVSGSILLNLDSEDEGELFIGCAGGMDTIASISYKSKPFPKGHVPVKLVVKGLRGGHSGDEIEKGLGNSIKIITRVLWNSMQKHEIKLSMLDGGNLRNAIPREAYAIVAVPQNKKINFEKEVQYYNDLIRKELKGTEPALEIFTSSVDMPIFIMNKKAQKRLLNALYACPHGVIAWSQDIEDLVETSTNLASVKMKNDNQVVITTSQRSSVESSKIDISNMVHSVFTAAKATVVHSDGYPGWTPDTNSVILNITKQAYQKLFKHEPIVRAIHAGLECGLFLKKYPNLDMISFGPTIKGAHSPDERLDIDSTTKFWDLLLEVLSKIPKME